MWRQQRRSALLSCFDNGAFSFWKAAQRSGQEWDETQRDWTPYFEWLEPRLFHPGRWAVIPDTPGAPSQLNDALLNDWPFGQKGAPLWHMDGPIERLLRLCDRYDRVCLGWTGAGKHLDNPDYHRRMEEVARALGNRWPPIHMMRGTRVAFDYPFASADSTSLAQNGWRYDSPLETALGNRWNGRRAYADALEGKYRRNSASQFFASVGGGLYPRTHLGNYGDTPGVPRRDAFALRAKQLDLPI
jgi:hypothetical protein